MNLSLSLSLSYTHTVDGSVHVFCYAQRDGNDFQDDADLRNLIRLLSQGEKFVSIHAKNRVFEIVGGNFSKLWGSILPDREGGRFWYPFQQNFG